MNLGEGLFAVTEGTKEWYYNKMDFSPKTRLLRRLQPTECRAASR
jgi:hypothetical protein